MARYVAFLRAINVGGRVVKMDELRTIFEGLRFANVETFIASGNVMFSTGRSGDHAIEALIGKKLATVLGYQVPTFVRSADEIARLAIYQPFPPAKARTALSRQVAFIASPLDPAATKRLKALETEFEEFLTEGREIHCLMRRGLNETTITPTKFDRTIGQPSSWRNINTVVRLAAKLSTAKS